MAMKDRMNSRCHAEVGRGGILRGRVSRECCFIFIFWRRECCFIVILIKIAIKIFYKLCINELKKLVMLYIIDVPTYTLPHRQRRKHDIKIDLKMRWRNKTQKIKIR